MFLDFLGSQKESPCLISGTDPVQLDLPAVHEVIVIPQTEFLKKEIQNIYRYLQYSIVNDFKSERTETNLQC
jgi:hypothetical protein